MMRTSAKQHVIVGLGMTGLSCARYLRQEGIGFAAMDTREQPPGLDDFRAEFPEVELTLGRLDAEQLGAAATLVLSPGIDPRLPAISQAVAQGVAVTGDIDLFSAKATAPLIAITGSNAKTTVTTLVGEMVKNAGFKVAVAGNIGTPVLDLLGAASPDYYVLELSSFQLETAGRLRARVAAVLNLSADHMDRYATLADYRRAKHRIFNGCQAVVVNRDDPASHPESGADVELFSFGLDQASGPRDFSVQLLDGREYLACAGEPWLELDRLKIAGRHNVANALAALAIGHAVGLPRAAMLQSLQDFRGLPHRCQWVANVRGADWYNDSKGTNVGATIAAIEGFGPRGPVILLAGGQGKGADFTPLAPVMARYGRLAVLFGADADKLQAALADHVAVLRADSLEQAVALAQREAADGDQVLLSPACASLDMFRNYEQRGDVFTAAVEALR
ncbi:MAG TPA: UDP-N-acetylmuramoyl-L-alanine--D-glutamate ligase [Pseudomonadaceae bacterium]|nr:UDP-N-acetylmuramoyl-L-alanine--D-glutamate ligase [Pseudomonadaceae bacterium]